MDEVLEEERASSAAVEKRPHPSLGLIMRRLRSRKGWTLREMSERTDIPASTLSKLEHDRLTLTYDRLVRVSEKLRIPLAELLSEGTDTAHSQSAAPGRRSLGIVGDAVRVTTRNYDYYYMCPELRHKRMIPVITRIRAQSLEEFGELVRHPGEEYIYVLEGAITVHTEYYGPLVLISDESLYVDSNMGHAYVATGCAEAIVLAVCSGADEGLLDELMARHGGSGGGS
jgi:transcriptional regulator with XRE-family HTH domain